MCSCSDEEYVENCPIIDGRECPEKVMMDWLVADKPWYQPGVPSLVIGGFMRTFELSFERDAFSGPEVLKSSIADMREKYHLDDYLVFKICPECGWELPAMDFNVSGECVLCSQKKKRDSGEGPSEV